MSEYSASSVQLLNSICNAFEIDMPLAELLKYELDCHIYYYGDHFSNPYEKDVDIELIGQKIETDLTRVSVLVDQIQQSPGIIERALAAEDGKKIIFSNAYYSWNHQLEQAGFKAMPPVWRGTESRNPDELLIRELFNLMQGLFALNFKLLVNPVFRMALDLSLKILEQIYSLDSVAAVLFPFTNPFYEGASTRILRKLGKPAFFSMHGIMKHLSWDLGEHECDYYCVWGPLIKQQLIEQGLDAERILVTGHPDHDGYQIRPVRFELDDILVCTRCMSGAPAYKLSIYQNRGFILDYLYRIQVVLKKHGVTRARFRPHPSESAQWYLKFIDENFWVPDDAASIQDSLAKSSLVIGPASTVFIESILAGVNYILFDLVDEYNPVGYKDMVAKKPFNGEDTRVQVPRSDSELDEVLASRLSCNPEFLLDYIQPRFDLSGIKSIIESK